MFSDGELEQKVAVADYVTIQLEGGYLGHRLSGYYNLVSIISIVRRVKSKRSIVFKK